MSLAKCAPWSLVFLSVACGAGDPPSSSEPAATNVGAVSQALTRTVLASADFGSGLAPFVNGDGRCTASTFEGSTGNGALCFGSTVLGVDVDARGFTDVQVSYKRATLAYEANDLLGVFTQGTPFPFDLVTGPSSTETKVINFGRGLENSQFTLNFQSFVKTDAGTDFGGLDFDIFGVDDFAVTAIPAVDDACDGIDQDNNGVPDDAFVGALTQCGIGGCATIARQICVNGVVKDACVPKPPAANDATCDQVDDDCDGRIDEDSGCSPPYRTIMVIGDTQSLAYPETRRPLREMLNWVRDNRDKDNIDLVLQVGDLVELGIYGLAAQFREKCGPTRQTRDNECLAGIPDVGPHSACRAATAKNPDAAISPLPCGCFADLPGPSGFSCAQMARDIDAQWAQIKSEFDRLNDTVPYVVVRGNHDNPNGSDFPGPKAFNQPRGFRDYFGPDFFMAQQARWLKGPRQFRVVSISDKYFGYAFQAKIGGRQDLLVLGLDDGGSSGEISWAQSVLTVNPTAPTIVMAHQGLLQASQLAANPPGRESVFWRTFIEPQEGGPAGQFAKQIFMTAQGHIDTTSYRDVSIGNGVGRVLQVWFDHQEIAPVAPKPPVLTLPDETYMAAVRFYLDTNDVEIVTVSARENKVLLNGPFSLSKRPFTIH